MKTNKQNPWQKCKGFFIRFYIKNKPTSRQDWIRRIILAVAIPVFLYCAVKIGLKLFDYAYADWQHSQIVDLKPTVASDPFDIADSSQSSSQDIPSDKPYQIILGTDTRLNDGGRLPEYEDLWKRNNDMVGWISMPGFKSKSIYYPIMYSGDNEYYVYRNFDKQQSACGSIFLDGSNTPYSSDPLQLDYNYVLYGHAMRNNSMFWNITDYFKNETAWKDSTKIYIDFMNTRLEYEVFSTFLIDPYYNYRQTSFSSDVEYQAYLDDMIAKSAHDFGIKVGPKDRIVTLSTCYQTTRRTAVIARLVRQIIYVKGDVSSNPGASVTPVILPTYEPTPTPKIKRSSAISSSSPAGSVSTDSASAASAP